MLVALACGALVYGAGVHRLSGEAGPSARCTEECSAYLHHLNAEGVTSYTGDGVCDDGGEGSVWGACALGTDCRDCGVRAPSSNVGAAPPPPSPSPPPPSLRPPPPPSPTPPPLLSVPTAGTLHGSSITTVTIAGVRMYSGDNIKMLEDPASHDKEMRLAMENLKKVSDKYGLRIEFVPPPPPPPGALEAAGEQMWQWVANQFKSPSPPPPGIAKQLTAQIYRQEGYQDGFNYG